MMEIASRVRSQMVLARSLEADKEHERQADAWQRTMAGADHARMRREWMVSQGIVV